MLTYQYSLSHLYLEEFNRSSFQYQVIWVSVRIKAHTVRLFSAVHSKQLKTRRSNILLRQRLFLHNVALTVSLYIIWKKYFLFHFKLAVRSFSWALHSSIVKKDECSPQAAPAHLSPALFSLPVYTQGKRPHFQI